MLAVSMAAGYSLMVRVSSSPWKIILLYQIPGIIGAPKIAAAGYSSEISLAIPMYCLLPGKYKSNFTQNASSLQIFRYHLDY